jgi:hypothetical protein
MSCIAGRAECMLLLGSTSALRPRRRGAVYHRRSEGDVMSKNRLVLSSLVSIVVALGACGESTPMSPGDAGPAADAASTLRSTFGECESDVDCQSGSCVVALGACRANEGEPCRVEIGCAERNDARVICLTASSSLDWGTCTRNDGRAYSVCTRDADCLDGSCSELVNRCGTGRSGDPCDDAGDCIGGLCLEQVCQDGAHGELCTRDGECDSGRCREGLCVDGRAGDACRDDTECDSFCNLESHRCADACRSPLACDAALVCTQGGACLARGSLQAGAQCGDDAQCASGSCFDYEGVFGTARCAALGADGTACLSPNDCDEGFVCSDHRCALPAGARCGQRFSQGTRVRGACAAGTECAPASDGLSRCMGTDTPCSNSSHCGGAECVLPYTCR